MDVTLHVDFARIIVLCYNIRRIFCDCGGKIFNVIWLLSVWPGEEALPFQKVVPRFYDELSDVGEKPAFMFEFLTKRTLNGNSMVIRNFL